VHVCQHSLKLKECLNSKLEDVMFYYAYKLSPFNFNYMRSIYLVLDGG